MSDHDRGSDASPDKTQLVSRLPQPDSSAEPVPEASEATFVGEVPSTLTTDTDPRIDLSRLAEHDEQTVPARPPSATRPVAKPSAPDDLVVPEDQPVGAIDSFGRELESFGATILGALRGAFDAVRKSVLRPVREQAAATWSRIRGVPVKEFEQHGEDKFDRARAKQWESFNRGKTSSSYLQDTDERRR
ncbi:MAG: hypothetical protein AAFQ82_02800 [Myxococcota bacterium]